MQTVGRHYLPIILGAVVCWEIGIITPAAHAITQEEFRDTYLETVNEDKRLRRADCSELTDWQCVCARRSLPIRVKNPSQKEIDVGIKTLNDLIAKGNPEQSAVASAIISVVRYIQKDIVASCRRPIFIKDDQ